MRWSRRKLEEHGTRYPEPVLMLSYFVATALLLALGSVGVALLHRFDDTFDPLEQFVYGLPLGVMAGTLLLLPLAILAGFSPALIVLVALACLAGAVALWPGVLDRLRRRPASVSEPGAPPEAAAPLDHAPTANGAHDLTPALEPDGAGANAAVAATARNTAILRRGPDGTLQPVEESPFLEPAIAATAAPAAPIPTRIDSTAQRYESGTVTVVPAASHTEAMDGGPAFPVAAPSEPPPPPATAVATAMPPPAAGVAPVTAATIAAETEPARTTPFAWVVLTGLTLLILFFYATAYEYKPDGLWAAQEHIWSDWTVHITHTNSFAFAENFPPRNPYWAGGDFNYHFLSSLTTAAMVKLGMEPAAALKFHGFVFTLFIVAGVFALGRRMTLNANAAALAALLFILGSGLGWLVTAGNINQTKDILGTLANAPWDYQQQTAANFRWTPPFIVAIAPTRGFLYGLPLALFIFTALLAAVRTNDRRLFLLAGLGAGLLPYAHLGTLLAMAMITPFLFLLFPRWQWAWFFGVWVALAVPQLLYQGGDSGGTDRILWHFGWMAYQDNVVWFWVKNLGLFFLFAVLALFDRRVLTPAARRFMWALLPLFVASNLWAFDPTGPWNNLKLLEYWFLGVCVLTAGLVVWTWREYRSPLVRSLLGLAVLSMLLSGALQHLHQIQGKNSFQTLSADELEFGRLVREQTEPRAVFATSFQVNHPVTMVGGRTVLMFFPGWLVSWGINPTERERDVRAMFALAPNAPELFQKYGVDCVSIGPGELREMNANVQGFRRDYPLVLSAGGYDLYAVSDRCVKGDADAAASRAGGR
jgi:hypothetical protein